MKKRFHSYLTRQNMLTNDYEIFHYSDQELDRVYLHHHDFYECYLFLSGDTSYIIEGKAYSLMPGDIVLVNSRELHQAIIHSKTIPYERIVLWINPSFLDRLSSDATDLRRCFEDEKRKNVIRADLDAQQNVKSILNKLLSLEAYSGLGRELLYKAYLTELLVFINSLLFQRESILNIEIKNSNLIDEIIVYINHHLEDDIRLDELSETFFISKYHLMREFKKNTGTSIHKYIIQKKLILAKELILSGIPIISIYKQCGFGDYSNFFRAFKNEYGVTPKQFMYLMRKGDNPG